MIRKIFFSYKGRLSREVFATSLASFILFNLTASTLFFKLLDLFLPRFFAIIILIPYCLCITYIICALFIKRLHDLNISDWALLLIMIPVLNIFFFCFLILKSGSNESNSYGDPLKYTGPKFLLFLGYGVNFIMFLLSVMSLIFLLSFIVMLVGITISR